MPGHLRTKQPHAPTPEPRTARSTTSHSVARTPGPATDLAQPEISPAAAPIATRLLHLQRTLGNRAVSRQIAQAKPGAVQREIEAGSEVKTSDMLVLPGHVWVHPGTRATVQSRVGDQLKIRFIAGPHTGTSTDVALKDVSEAPITLVNTVPQIEESQIPMMSDDLLFAMLRGAFGANWFSLRNSLTLNQWPASYAGPKPSRAASLLMMDRMVTMRDRKWNKFKNDLLPKIKAEIAAVAAQQISPMVKEKLTAESTDAAPAKDHAKTFDPVGSQAVTSDIDLSMGGKNTEIAVGFINREFRKEFGVPYDPGTVFDINVYAKDWIFGASDTVTETGGAMVIQPGAEARVAGSASILTADRRSEVQEIWSMVKIRRNMTNSEWAIYKSTTLAGLKADEAAKAAAIGKFARVEFEYKVFLGKVKLKMAELAKQDALLGKTAASSAFGAEPADDGLNTRASNALYAEILLRVKQIRLQIEAVRAELETRPLDQKLRDNFNRLGIALGYAIAESLTYANEVYASEGAVQHTVLAQGAGKKMSDINADRAKKGGTQLTSLNYALTSGAWLQSVNENVGDSLHSLHAYHSEPKYAVYRAGKYVGRLIDATNNLIGEGDAAAGAMKAARDVPHYRELKTLGDEAKRAKAVKTQVKTKELEGVPDTVLTDPYFRSQDAGTLHAFQEQIVIFGAAAALQGKQANLPRLSGEGRVVPDPVAIEAPIGDGPVVATASTPPSGGTPSTIPDEVQSAISGVQQVFADQDKLENQGD